MKEGCHGDEKKRKFGMGILLECELPLGSCGFQQLINGAVFCMGDFHCEKQKGA